MSNIRIENLSVGDWVQDKIGSIAQIIGIENWSDGYALNVRIKGVDVGCVSANAIEPIPLTQEILKKNGFECIEVGDKGPATQKQNYMRYEHWRGETTWGRRDLFYDRMTKKWRFGGMNEYRFDEVHKLQHAIRFSGWDKEIEL
jgi:hypothetical protein